MPHDSDDARPLPAWDVEALRDPHRRPDKAPRVQRMFDAIAPTYECVNTVASLGRDATWRRRAVAAAAVTAGDIVLDVGCGTGDMVRAFARGRPAPQRIVAVDFAAAMLARGRFDGTGVPVHVLRSDALCLPLRDARVDVVSCAFGVRNFRALQVGLAEMWRVLRPGGRVVILEFALPERRFARWLCRTYCEWVLPVLAAAISRERMGAYRYLARSIGTFEPARSIVRRLEDIGFEAVTTRAMNLGGVVLYRAVKPVGRG